MQWFRWYHGTCADPKLGSIARKCGETRERVIATWAMVLEAASDASDRGAFAIDAAGIADVLSCDTESVAVILAEMEVRGMLVSGRVTKWDTRQPAADNVAERVRKHRQRVKETLGNGYGNRDTRNGNAADVDTEKETEEETALTESVANATGAVRRQFASPIGGEQQPADPEPTRGDLIGLARKQGFNADGTDADIIDTLLRKRVGARDIANVIDGLALLVKAGGYPAPGDGKLSMRMLYSKKHGKSLPVWTRAADAYIAAENARRPVSLGSL